MTRFSTATLCHFRPECFYHSRSAAERAVVAVSACLAGEKVRYDGADKLTPAYSQLSGELALMPICPEAGAGLGVPRAPVQLVVTDGGIRALGRENASLDVTAALQQFAVESLQQLEHIQPLCGYLWKSRSPSCGFGSTPLFDRDGLEAGRTDGIQAGRFRRRLPHLSYCEETALETPETVAAFVLRCRLVFDFLHAPVTPIRSLHEHYAFLHRHFSRAHVTNNLNVSNAADDRRGYLVAFLEGCNQIPGEMLLGMFT